NGYEIYFRDERDPEPRSRSLFNFHRPEELSRLLQEENTLRARLKELPSLNLEGLRECQVKAIKNLEQSFSEARPRALIQMATGSGKTYTAVSSVYRLIKYAKAKRVLFLVDRRSLGEQALREFEQYVTPDDGRKFKELYNIQLLKSNALDKISKVTITTIQRFFSMLKGEEDIDEDLENQSLFTYSAGDESPIDIEYNSNIPIETYDFIIVDECHRSIYNKWRQVLEYFDSFIIGLTATPAKHTYGFFNKNLVMEYSHEEAVADNVNVGCEIYQILTKITKEGSKVEAKKRVFKRDKLTREERWELLDEELEYDATQLDRKVVAKDQIRTIIKTFKSKLFTEIFPGRREVPKTVVFAKDDSHAEDIVH
ncbi:MAG: DEAD/DEAH box helicase family protein, partial [Candidatus Heimdallarchaeota archaeon]|nr:DEAD/DEAH box helicase family protein [Candidatus Heimdallarchaeota archaeon]MCK4254306.1 DEAD/DEAH box helicase family protein [Candidatus Heimdallarchaeota archaeon]